MCLSWFVFGSEKKELPSDDRMFSAAHHFYRQNKLRLNAFFIHSKSPFQINKPEYPGERKKMIGKIFDNQIRRKKGEWKKWKEILHDNLDSFKKSVWDASTKLFKSVKDAWIAIFLSMAA